MAARVMSPRDWALILLLSLLWGGSFFFVELAVAAVAPLTLVLARVGLAAAALLAVLRLRGMGLPKAPRVWLALAIMGGLNNVLPFSLIAWAQSEIPSGIAAILNATTPLFSVLLAHLATRDERLTRLRLAGVVLGLAGVVAMIGPEAMSGVRLTAIGQLAVLAAAAAYACAGLYGRRLRELPPVVAAAGMLTASTLLLLPIVLLAEGPPAAPPDLATAAAVVALALISTAAAYLIYFRVLASAGATNLLLVTFLIPVSALCLGIAFLGERPGASAFAGMALICLGLAAIDGRPLAALRRRSGRPAAAQASTAGTPPGS